MIRGLHGLFYSSQPEMMRDFMRDKLRLPFTDVGEGWLIFDLPEADVGVHPTEDSNDSGKHDLSFYCDDIQGTVSDLRSRGVEFDAEVQDHGYGYVTYFTMPGDVRVQLYEPKYEKRSSAPKPVKRAAAAKRKAARPARTARPAARSPKRKPAAVKARPAAKRKPKAKPGARRR
jgi:hypothetical protein